MFLTALGALMSYWRRHPGQLVTLLGGLAIATALWSGVQAINAEARASYAEAASALGQDELDRLVNPDGPFSQDVYIALRRAGWAVSPVIEGTITRDSGVIRILGIDPITAPPAAQAIDLSQTGDLRAFLAGEMYGPPELVSRLGESGIAGQLRASASLPANTLLMDIGQAQQMLDQRGLVSHLLLWPTQHEGLVPIPGIAPALERAGPDARSDVASLTDSFHLNLTAFGLLSFAVGLFIVHSAIGLAFEQRRGLFRTLRALGVPARTLVGLLAAETLTFALVAGLVGMVAGYGIAVALLPDVAATLQGLYGATVDGALSLRPAWWIGGLAIAVLGAGVAAAQSLWRIWRLPIFAPAQPRAWVRASEAGLRLQALVALGLIGLASLLGAFGAGLLAGFAMLGFGLVGAALLLPVVLSALLRAGSRLSTGPLGQWFWADTRQQLPGLSLALMALLLALAANIGVSTMVGSFRLTFTGWLDQRLASEVYVTARSEAEAEALRTWLAPRVDAILPIWNLEARLAGQPGEVYGVADHPTYRDNWPLLAAAPDVWDQVAQGTGVLINEQLSRREGLLPGDTVRLPQGWDAPIAGIYSDYGNPEPQAMVGLSAFAERYPDTPRLRYALRVPAEEADALMQAMQSEFGLPADTMIDQASIKAISLQIFERTFTVTGALNILTLSVAAIAMLTSLLTLARMRLPQLAPVWALGMTRGRLAQLEILRTALLGALTAIAALPVGLVLAWVLLAVINVEAFGWRLPMHLFPRDWAVLAVLAVATAVIAAAWPARRLATRAPGDLLKVFANER
ncbi:FtsX-like permease family protein [Tropicimonas sp. S265A]|uniref:FtsX-like permease family protein n=1 Tax=Tropicimonas sp. S265A TaxID=3415134 RepID=UPI003C7DBD7C